ncbi:MAG: sigma-70 family RNA polymerase sigma factor [Cyanobacteria bacterium P01_A01_bin.37]
MSELDIQLKQLVAKACTCSRNSSDRQMHLQELHYLVTTSNKLWKEREPYYSDAVQDMWIYCFQNLEEYDPTRAGVITWLDYHLKRILRNYRDRRQRDQRRHLSPLPAEEGDMRDPINALPSRPDVSPLLEMWDQTVDWVQRDPDGTLKATCFRRREDINAQTLFLMRFPVQPSWKSVADQFNLSPAEATDLPKFYNRRCLPLLRAFGKNQGYLNSP